MKHGIISIICLLFLVNVLGGDELSDKQKQLDKVQKDLQKAQQKIEQNEAKKKKNETEISNTRRAKQKSDVELRRTQEIAREKLQSLNVVKTELRSVEEQIGDLKAMQNTQLIKMVRVSRRNGKIGFIHKDRSSARPTANSKPKPPPARPWGKKFRTWNSSNPSLPRNKRSSRIRSPS